MNLHRRAKTCPASRALLVRRVLEEGWTADRGADAAGVSRRTARKWIRRFRLEGESGLQDRSSRPLSVPRRTPERVRGRIVELRGKRLVCREISSTVCLPRSTVSRILRIHGLGRLLPLEPPPPIHRYELPEPGDLLHADIKKLGRIVGGAGHRATGNRQWKKRRKPPGWEYVYVCVDDHSRLSYSEDLSAEDKETAAGFIERAFVWFVAQGVTPRRLMTDNGKVFTSQLFGETCERFGVRQKFTKPYHPRTNGKAERFIQTLLREWAYRRTYRSSRQRLARFSGWLHHYNFHRRHSALGDRPPASRVNNLISRDS